MTTPPGPAPGEALGWAASVAAVTMWAGWAVATRGSLNAFAGAIQVADLVALRFAVAGLITLPYALLRPLRLGRLGPARGIAVAAMGGFAFSLCNTGGFAFAPASHGGALTAPLGAVFTGALAAWVLREPISRARAGGLGLILAGAAALLAATFATGLPASIFIGHALFVAAALQWAIYTVLVREARLAPLESLSICCVGSALLYLPGWLLLRGPEALLAAPWQTLLTQGLLHGVVGQTGSIVLFNLGVVRLGASRAAASGALVPPMVAAGATLFLAEPPALAELPGLAALTLGVWLASRRAAPRA